MADYEKARDVWEFEAQYCRDTKAWTNVAWDLRHACEALLLHDNDERDRFFRQKIAPRLPLFRSSNIQRMLMGFSLENLLKALILMNPEKAERAFSKEGNLRWVVKGHDLNKLSNEAEIAVSPKEENLLDVVTTCATWAGRYPLPKNENELPYRRKPAQDRATLARRRAREHEKAMAEGKEVEIDLFDKLHTGIGQPDLDLYREFFDRILHEIENRKADSKRS